MYIGKPGFLGFCQCVCCICMIKSHPVNHLKRKLGQSGVANPRGLILRKYIAYALCILIQFINCEIRCNFARWVLFAVWWFGTVPQCNYCLLRLPSPLLLSPHVWKGSLTFSHAPVSHMCLPLSHCAPPSPSLCSSIGSKGQSSNWAVCVSLTFLECPPFRGIMAVHWEHPSQALSLSFTHENMDIDSQPAVEKVSPDPR